MNKLKAVLKPNCNPKRIHNPNNEIFKIKFWNHVKFKVI